MFCGEKVQLLFCPYSPTSCHLVSVSLITAEIGDFDEVQCKQHLLNNKYIPEQDTLMDKIIGYHRKHV